jgi:hypothetical protein
MDGYLMGTTDEVQVIDLEKFFKGIRTEKVTDASLKVFLESLVALSWIRPQQVADNARIWNLCWPIDFH